MFKVEPINVPRSSRLSRLGNSETEALRYQGNKSVPPEYDDHQRGFQTNRTLDRGNYQEDGKSIYTEFNKN